MLSEIQRGGFGNNLSFLPSLSDTSSDPEDNVSVSSNSSEDTLSSIYSTSSISSDSNDSSGSDESDETFTTSLSSFREELRQEFELLSASNHPFALSGNHNASTAVSRLSQAAITEIRRLYSSRYLKSRTHIKKAPSSLNHTLNHFKLVRPDLFRRDLRVSASCFDDIVLRIQDDPVFQSNSFCKQMPVDRQLAVMLYRFGHFGNGASIHRAALWAGVGVGTVYEITRRVMTALSRPRFRQDAVPWPTDEEIEEAKDWVERNSCKAWRNGFLFMDGSLVKLFEKPYWFGESYYDRKGNYSFNIQVSPFLVSYQNILTIPVRLLIFLIYKLWTTDTDTLGVHMTPQLGMVLEYIANQTNYWGRKSLYGLTLGIR